VGEAQSGGWQMAVLSIRPWPAGDVGKQSRRLDEAGRGETGQMDRRAEWTRPGGVGRDSRVQSAGRDMVVGG
jgi:hypothetical protein